MPDRMIKSEANPKRWWHWLPRLVRPDWSDEFKKAYLDSYEPSFCFSPRRNLWKIDYTHYSGRKVKIREARIEDALKRNKQERKLDEELNDPF